ncbi:hypothetical protein L7F22_048826 [Adiantum nelumboides]|nr:hypothetical protein [Adiantum nelumboides]
MLAIRDHVKKQMLADMCASPFNNKGKGCAKCYFVALLPIANANAKSIFDAMTQFLEDIGLNVNKLIAIAIDGASMMIGHKTCVIARFQMDMPCIMGVHCIAHRQTLAAKDGFVSHPHVYAFVDKVANKVYSWLGKSGKRHEELWKIMCEYDLGDVKALQIYSVQWLSRGKVMERLVNIMLAVLEQWKCREKTCVEFQRQEMDVTTIGALIDLAFEKLTRRYLTNDAKNFGVGSHYLSTFLGMTKESKLVYVDATGKSHSHIVKFKPILKLKRAKRQQIQVNVMKKILRMKMLRA